eukprot:scaffold26975_cov135-Isochrysis_galbana.AAC.2
MGRRGVNILPIEASSLRRRACMSVATAEQPRCTSTSDPIRCATGRSTHGSYTCNFGSSFRGRFVSPISSSSGEPRFAIAPRSAETSPQLLLDHCARRGGSRMGRASPAVLQYDKDTIALA